MLYYRLCRGLVTKGKLIPVGINPFENINDQDRDHDYYISIYNYNTDHKKVFDVNGSIAGIKDGVVTNKLLWDFDSEDNIDLALSDTKEIIKRLEKLGIEQEYIDLYFSGKKGTHVVVNLEQEISVEQFTSFTHRLAIGLKTFDDGVCNPSRVVRLPYTRHKETGLYKIPITIQQLNELSVDEIKELAKIKPDVMEDLPKIKFQVPFVEKEKKTSTSKKQSENVQVSPLNFDNKPKWISHFKYALLNGYFPAGIRKYALNILAATLKRQGFDHEQTLGLLHSAAEKQAVIHNMDKKDDYEIENAAKTVFTDKWNGGTYSEDNFPQKLKDYLISIGVPDKENADIEDQEIEFVSSGFNLFQEYAENIDKYTMKFGIPELDTKLKVRKGHLIGLIAPPGVGKCLAFDTEVLMSNGNIKKVQDIKVGDKVMGDDSTPRTVQSLARGRETMYKIHTDDGSYTVNESHILSLKTTQNIHGLDKGSVINISVKEYLGMSDHFKRRTMGYRNSIEFNKQEIPFDPYLIGLWLGDGTRSKPEISNPEPKIKSYIENFAKDNGFKITTYENDRCPRYNIVTERGQENSFWSYLKETFNSGEKFIPQEYKINSKEHRLKLLAGILDTDGHRHLDKDSYEVTFKDKKLSEDLRFLCRSLGFKATLKETKKSCEEFTGTYYRLYITGDLTEVPFLLEKRKQVGHNKQRNPQWYRIKVEKLEEDNYYGFELDGNRLFVLGDLSVTHNTSMAISILNNMSKAGTHCFFGSYDMYKNNVYQKLIQRHMDISEDELFQYFVDRDEEKIEKMRETLISNYENVSFCFRVGQSIQDLKTSIKFQEKITGKPVELVVVDYLELILTHASDPTAASAEAAQGLREISNEGRVVLMLLQPNKMSSKPNEPLLSYNAAKGSSAIAQAATAILTAHRPGLSSRNPESDKYFSIDCVKNRNGALFNLDFGWKGSTQTIYTLDEIERQELTELREFISDQNEDI